MIWRILSYWRRRRTTDHKQDAVSPISIEQQKLDIAKRHKVVEWTRLGPGIAG